MDWLLKQLRLELKKLFKLILSKKNNIERIIHGLRRYINGKKMSEDMGIYH